VAPGRCQWSSDDASSDGARAVSTKPASNERKSSLRGASHSERRADQDDRKSDLERQRTSGRGRRCDDERSRRSRHRRSQVSFCDSASESDSDIERSQRKQFMKAPKFDGSSMSFETFYAKFQICVKYNRWSKSEQLAFLSASLSGEAGQVLWDPSITSSLSKLTQLLESRFGAHSSCRQVSYGVTKPC